MSPTPDDPRKEQSRPPEDFDESLVQVPDRELLELYLYSNCRDAMATLIRRYGPIVASVCRLTVSDPQSAEDAFQATFLILMQSAGKIKNRDSLAAWLHGVAYRTACRIRKQQLATSATLKNESVEAAHDASEDPVYAWSRRIDLETLNQELENLPTSLRGPLVEHYLLGLTAARIADRLDLTTTTVQGRIRRGRRALRLRLAQRGISMSIVLAGSTFLQQQVQAAEAQDWSQAVINDYLPDTGASPSHNDVPSSTNPDILSLVSGELHVISTGILKATAALGAIALAGTYGVIAIAGGIPSGQDGAGPAPTRISAPASTAGASAQIAPPAAVQASLPLSQPPASNAPPRWFVNSANTQSDINRYRDTLSIKVSADFVSTPLQSVISDFSQELGIPIRLNRHAIEGLGLGIDSPVDLSLPVPTTLRSALGIILEPLELTWAVSEAGIEITSLKDARARTNFRVYDMSRINVDAIEIEDVVNAIEMSIEPSAWACNGGVSSIAPLGSKLIVNAPEQTQYQIQRLLLNIAQTDLGDSSQASDAVKRHSSAQTGQTRTEREPATASNAPSADPFSDSGDPFGSKARPSKSSGDPFASQARPSQPSGDPFGR